MNEQNISNKAQITESRHHKDFVLTLSYRRFSSKSCGQGHSVSPWTSLGTWNSLFGAAHSIPECLITSNMYQSRLKLLGRSPSSSTKLSQIGQSIKDRFLNAPKWRCFSLETMHEKSHHCLIWLHFKLMEAGTSVPRDSQEIEAQKATCRRG